MITAKVRIGALLGVVLLLMLLLALRPPGDEAGAKPATGYLGEEGAGEYELRLSERYMPFATANSARDIFDYDRRTTHTAAEQQTRKPAVEPAIQRDTRNQSKAGKDEVGSTSLKLVGMLFKDKDRLAFVFYRGKPYTLREKELLGNRYEVLSISETALSLRNRNNNRLIVITL